jgi:hypothetical protein
VPEAEDVASHAAAAVVTSDTSGVSKRYGWAPESLPRWGLSHHR